MKKKNIRMTVVIALLAITMISMEAHALTLTLVHPNGGEKFAPGDTVTISWIFSGDGADGYHNVVSVLSVDGGLNYNLPLFSKGYVYSGASGSTRWVVPNDGIYFSNQASIEIYEYSQKTTVNDQSDDAFVIEGKNIVPPIPRDSIKDTALVDGWSRMSGGAGGKVVYSDYNSIYVLDLRSGVRKKISSFEWT